MKGKKLALIIVPIAIIFMAGIVFLALWLSRGRPDYQGASKYIGEIISRESVVNDFVNSNENFNYEDIDRDSIGSFQNAVSSISSYYESLGASTALIDDEVSRYYNELSPFVDKLTEIAASQDILVNYVDKVSASGYASAKNELDKLIASPNTFILTLGNDLSDYYATLADFEEKYQGGKAVDYNKMIEEYGNFVLAGEKLNKKYSNVTFENVFNITPTAISNYFHQLRDLETYLKAQL